QRPAGRAAGRGGGRVPFGAPAGSAAAGAGSGHGVLRDHPPPRASPLASSPARAGGPAHGRQGAISRLPPLTSRLLAGTVTYATSSRSPVDHRHVVALTCRSRTSAGTRGRARAMPHN